MKKRIYAALLVIALLFTNMGLLQTERPISFAYDLETMRAYLLQHYGDCTSEDKTAIAEAKAYMANQMGSTQFYNTGRRDKQANMGILMHFGKIAYTYASDNHFEYVGRDELMKGEDGNYHYRYLGWNWSDSAQVTNPDYPNVAGTTDFFSSIDNKIWVKSAEALSTWKNSDINIANYMLNDAKVYAQDDGVLTDGGKNLTVSDVLDYRLGVDGLSVTTDNLKRYAKYLTPASTYIYGSVRIDQAKYYRSLDLEPVPFPEPEIQVTYDKSLYTFSEDETSKIVSGTVTINFDGFDSMKINKDWQLDNYVDTAIITVEGMEYDGIITNNTIKTNFSYPINRGNYSAGDSSAEETTEVSYAFELQELFLHDNYTDRATASVPVYVTAGDVEATFDIRWTNELGADESVKDSTISYTSWHDFPLRLVPDVEVYGDNVVTGIAWQLVNGSNIELKTGSQSQTVSYVINQSKEAAFLSDGVATFRMYVNVLYPTATDKTYPYQIVRTGTVEFVKKTEPEEDSNKPPVAKLKAPDSVKLGEEFPASAAKSYDPDGEITKYRFSGSEFELVENTAVDRIRGTYLDGTSKELNLFVYDNDGNSDKSSKEILIEDPFRASFSVYGKHKEKYKITLSAAETKGTTYYPVDSYTWTITPTAGQGSNAVVYETGNTGKNINIGFKKPGTYAVTLTAHSTCTFPGETDKTFSDTITRTITIQPDEAPVAGLSVMGLALRNPGNNLLATIEAVSQSYSPDGDRLRITGWYKKFNSDNDNSLMDETWESLGTTDTHISTDEGHVGDYYYYITVQEYIPDEETLPAYFKESDFLTDTSLDEPMATQHCFVDNVAPVISTTATLEKAVELVVITDESGANYTSLLTEMSRAVKAMAEQKIDLKTEFININGTDVSLISAGMKKIQTFIWNRWWNVFLHFNWYEYENGDFDNPYRVVENPKMKFSGKAETKTGTIEDMISWATYPEAYAVIDGVSIQYDEHSGGEDTYEITQIPVSVYNAPNDFLMSDRYYNASGYTYQSYDDSNEFSIYHNGSRTYGADGLYSNEWSALERYPSINQGDNYVSDWIPETLSSETEGEYKVLDIDNYLSKYSDSVNDKYLVFAIANGENFFMTDEMRTKLKNVYGFENVYFSVNDFWGEFKPTAPEAIDVRLADSSEGGLYALTEYGNEIYNYSAAADVYYSQSSEADTVDYEADLNGKGFVAIPANTGYMTGFINPCVLGLQANLDNYNSGYTADGRMIDVDVDAFWGKGTVNTYQLFDPTTSWVMADGTMLDVKNYYISNGVSSYYYKMGAIVETTDGKFYYVAPNFSFTNGRTGPTDPNVLKELVATELDISGIDAVYSGRFNESFYFRDALSVNSGSSSYDVDLGLGIAALPEDIFIVRDVAGGYVFCKPTMSFTQSDYREYSYTTSRGKTYYTQGWFYGFKVENFVRNIESLSKLSIYTKDVNYSSFYVEGEGLFAYEKFTNKNTLLQWTNLLTNYNLMRNLTNLSYEFFTYSLVDENGNMIIDDVHRISGVRGGDVSEDACAYIDMNGVVYGKGKSYMGSMGQQGTRTAFGKVFNTPYILNSTYSTKTFSSIYDFTSENPGYGLTARGVYGPIVDSILEAYADYSTNEDVYIQVGDMIDISHFVIDREGDPMFDMGVEVEVDGNYYDNTGTPPTLPDDFTQPFFVDQAGKLTFIPWFIDNPVGNDDNFAELRYRNRDNTTVTVYAHRPPIAVQGYAIVPQSDGSFNYVASDKGSYDLDHVVSRPDKGIVGRKYYYKKGLSPTWTEYDGTLPLELGVQYSFALKVQDLEKAWSDYDIKEIKIDSAPFILDASIDPPYPTGVPAGSSVTISAEVFTYKAISSIVASIDGASVTLSKTGQTGMTSTYQGTYTVPATKADYDYYPVSVKATASDTSVRMATLKLNVQTPIDLKGTAPDAARGDIKTITAQTSPYATSCTAKLFSDTGAPVSLTLSKTSLSGGVQNWAKNYTFIQTFYENTSVTEAYGGYKTQFDASAANGTSDTDSDNFDYVASLVPEVEFVSAPFSVQQGTAASFSVKITDPDADMTTLTAYVSTDAGLTWTQVHSESGVGSGSTKTFGFTVTGENPYLVRAVVADPFTLTSEAETGFVVITNQAPTVEIKSVTPDPIYEGDDVTITVLPKDEDGDMLSGVLETSKDGGVTWIVEETYTDLTEGVEIEVVISGVEAVPYTVRFTAEDPDGLTGSDQTNFDVIPVSLFDLRVTAITDYSFEDEISSPVYVGDMAIDESNHSTGKLMKLGYAFNFEVDSIGLDASDDTVMILPTFRTLSGTPLQMYYGDEVNDFILGVDVGGGTTDTKDLFTLYYSGEMHSDEALGSFSVLMLPTSLRSVHADHETWKGRYGLPTSAVFVPSGADPETKANRYTGKVIVEFVPLAVKEGFIRFNYVDSGQWEKERWSGGSKVNVVKYSAYDPGELIIIDAAHTSNDDYDADRILR